MGRRKVEREVLIDLGRKLGDRSDEQAACDRGVLPHQRLAVPEQLLVSLGERLAPEDAHRLIVVLRREMGKLAGGAFDETPCQAARRERTARRASNPIADQIAARRQGERHHVDALARLRRKLERKRHPHANGGTGEGLARSERHAGGDGGEGVADAVVGVGGHATPELPLLLPRQQRRRDFVERDGGCFRRKPIEIVDEPIGERDADGGHQTRRDRSPRGGSARVAYPLAPAKRCSAAMRNGAQRGRRDALGPAVPLGSSLCPARSRR